MSSGRRGVQPDLALSYDSGNGNGAFGLGWSLGLPSVTRRTDRGLPRYDDGDESDVFVLSGAEDLVPVLVPAPAGGVRRHTERRSASGEDYDVGRYRPRIEGLFARIEKWTSVVSGHSHWRSISRDNVTTLYGRTAESRISDPADDRRTFSWLICETRDDKGDAVLYRYRPEDRVGIDEDRVEESHRQSPDAFTNRHLKRVLYGNRMPSGPDEDLTIRDDWMFEAVLDYGEHDATNPRPDASVPWHARSDAFSSYRPGFEVRTYRLCRRILFFHHFPGERDVGADCLVRALDLEHDRSPIASVLKQVRSSGYRRDGSGYRDGTLPALDLGYTTSALLDPTAPRTFPILEMVDGSLDNVPTGLHGTSAQWVDLDGEGMNGLLTDQGCAWFYKRNLGKGRLAPLEEVPLTPALGGRGSRAPQLLDLDGDGAVELVDFAGATPGFSERDGAGWSGFRTFSSLPVLDWADPNLRFLDLTGDGHADVVLAQDEALSWHPALGSVGFGPARTSPWATDEDRGARLVFADGTDTIFLADLSGDGLIDLARVRNGEVSYWPNLGYGRFGPKVTMGRAPIFDTPELFDPRRVRLADVDGSGATDLLYLGRAGVDLYLNESGNAWSPARRIEIPLADTASDVEVLDLLGTGTACLVWSTALPGEASRPLRYVDLMATKPYLLNSTDNNLGAETHTTYAASTSFYARDREAGRRWATTLPFPVHVVERVEIRDRITASRFSTIYRYHDGHYDGHEREFRGFGMVEQRDTEEFTGGDGSPWHVPPVLTKTWFHTGAEVSHDSAEDYFREPGLTDAQAREQRLPEADLPTGLTAEEWREAHRALKGTMLRQELYAEDGSTKAAVPYTVVQQASAVRRLQERDGQRHAVFLAHPVEALNHHYERVAADPRTSHTLTIEVDDFGNVVQQCTVAYGRRRPDPTLAEAADRATQARTLITFTASRFTGMVDQPTGYRAPLPAVTRTYELTGYVPSGPAGRFRPLDLVQPDAGGRPTLIGDGEIAYENHPTGGRQRRLIEHVRTRYRRDDLTALLELGELQPLALPGETYTLALRPGLLAAVYRRGRSGQPDENLLPSPGPLVEARGADGGGYIAWDGGWWIPSGRTFFDPAADVTDPARTAAGERDTARRHFYLVRRSVDAFGHASVTDYDANDLLVVRTRDALGNTVTAENDYRVLQPAVVTDPNRNRTAALFDALGVVIAVTRMGKDGNPPDDVDADPSLVDLQAFVADPRAHAAALLGKATTRTVYDLGLPARADQPRLVATLARETYSAPTRIRISFSFADGLGREIQQKIQAEAGESPQRHADVVLPSGDARPGDLVRDAAGDVVPAFVPQRWVGSGRTVLNNKGAPVRQFEPFFSATHRHEPEPDVTDTGVSSVLLYDPLGRVIATLHPDHTVEKLVFGPWHQVTHDANDTVLIDPDTDDDLRPLLLGPEGTRRFPAHEYLPTWHALRVDPANDVDAALRWPDPLLREAERTAATVAAAHAGTPQVAHLDALGRSFVTFEDNGPDPARPARHIQLATRTELDVEGNQLAVRDAIEQDGDRLGRIVMRYRYDLVGRRIHQSGMEAGERWTLPDATGKPVRAWDSRGFARRLTYDALRRPTALYVTENGAERLAVETEYGEGRGDAANHRTRVHRVRDGAGTVTNEAYDFAGNLTHSSRLLLVDHKTTVDWSVGPALQGGSPHTTVTTYDALDRPVTITSPDHSVYRPTFNDANLLDRVDVHLRGAALPTPFVTNIDYDAKGQRQRIVYANGAVTTHHHDPLTFRPIRLTTTRPTTADATASTLFRDPSVVQDLHYTYDPVGNLTRIADPALLRVLHANQPVEPVSTYTYDALYRLIEAHGREHIGQTTLDLDPPGGNHRDHPFVGNRAHPNDLQAMRNYTELYEYDGVGNITQLRHIAVFTRHYDYLEASLVEAAKRSNRLTRTRLRNGTDRTEPCTHDAHGNVTSMAHLASMVWDDKDQLRRVDLGGGGAAYYSYDAAGQRVRTVVESQNGTRQRERLYLGGVEIYREYDGGGATTLERESLHVMDDQRRIALVETQTVDKAGLVAVLVPLQRYQFGNHLGSASVELDVAGAMISYEEYHPYGTTSFQAGRSAVEVSLKRYGYTSKERDQETGFTYHGARYYAPWLGRWTSCEPSGLVGGPNLYWSCSDSPVSRFDPNGREDLDAVRVHPTLTGSATGIRTTGSQQYYDNLAAPVIDDDVGAPQRGMVQKFLSSEIMGMLWPTTRIRAQRPQADIVEGNAGFDRTMAKIDERNAQRVANFGSGLQFGASQALKVELMLAEFAGGLWGDMATKATNLALARDKTELLNASDELGTYMLKTAELSRNERGPVLTTVLDSATKEIFHGLNIGRKGAEPTAAEVDHIRSLLQPLLKERLDAQEKLVAEMVEEGSMTLQAARASTAGTHSEIIALNKAMEARVAKTGMPVTADMLDAFMMHNRALSGKRMGGSPPPCFHCAPMTSGVSLVH